MGVAGESEIKVTTAAFEARFDNAYRYLDRCGETFVRIREQDKRWIAEAASPAIGILVNDEAKLALQLGIERMGLSRRPDNPIPNIEAEKLVEDLAEASSWIYPLTTMTLEIPTTIRVGARFEFILSADSAEDADRFVVRATPSDYTNELSRVANGRIFEAALSHRVEDKSTGIRRHINVQTKLQVPKGVQVTGLPLSGDTRKAIVSFDVDSYTRSESGHFPDVRYFIRTAYYSSHNLTRKLIKWINDRRS